MTQVLDPLDCDLLTISPGLLAELSETDGEVQPHLSVADARLLVREPLDM
jgi:hypothetical protein